MAKTTNKRSYKVGTANKAAGSAKVSIGKSVVKGSNRGVSSARGAKKAIASSGKANVYFGGADFTYTAADDNNLLDIIEVVRTGISPADFSELAQKVPFTIAEWADYLQLSERTIQRNQKEKKAFQPIQSEKIVELAMLYNYGVAVFGNKNSFDIWLDAKSIALDGRRPKELLDTNFGISLVKDELGRIEHGILA